VTRAALVMLIWAGLLAINTAVMVIFNANFVSFALLGGASVATALVAALVLLGRGRAPASDPDATRAVTDLSMASAWTGIGVALLALSGRFGVFLTVIAAAMILFGLGGVARELRVERRLARAAEERRR
jgi:hypothetical protein